NLGSHPETGRPVKAGIGRFGPYVVHEGGERAQFKSIPKDVDVLKVDLATAVELLKQARTRRGATALRELGPHPADSQPVQVFSGKYGPYVKHGKTNATIPKEMTVEQVTLEQALALLEARQARGGASSGRRTRRQTPKGPNGASPPKGGSTRRPEKPPK